MHLLYKKLSYCRDSARRIHKPLSVKCQKRPLRRSGSFWVTDFGANRKLVCHFLFVNNTNLHLILHHFQVIAKYWSNHHFWQLTRSFGETPEFTTMKFSLEKLRTSHYLIIVWRGTYFDNLDHLGGFYHFLICKLLSANNKFWWRH